MRLSNLHRHRSFIIACIIMLGWTACRQSRLHGDDLPTETSRKINQLILDFTEDQKIPGMSVAVATQNHLRFSKGYGLADVENGVATTTGTKYRTASIAKSMTAVVVMSLVEEGKIDLDAEVQAYCPAYPKKRWPLSSRHLLGHLGGVRHYKSINEPTSTAYYPDLNSALGTFRDDPLLHPPGSKFRYTTFGYNLLGSISEGAAKDKFAALLKRRVFDPAGMDNTVVDGHAAIIPHRTRGYIHRNAVWTRDSTGKRRLKSATLTNAPLHDTSVKIPGGGLLSTAPDLVRFATALNTQKLLTTNSVQQMWTRQKTTGGVETNYGFGWAVGKQTGRSAVWHTGSQSGTATVLLLIPETGTAVALMCNLQRTKLLPLAEKIAALAQSNRPTTAIPPALNNSIPAVIERLQAAVEYEVEQKRLPAFSISIVEKDNVLWAAGFGFQDAAKTIPATENTVYRVGSVSKLFTDLALMKQVEKGKVDLDAPIQTYLPDLKPDNPFGVPITLRQMMGHRSGLVRESPVGNYFDPTEPTLAETVASLNSTSLVYRPETKTKYSNAAVSVVGAVLEKRLGQSHADYVASTIFGPLKMNSSSFTLTPEVKKNLATAWMWTYDDRRFEAPTFLLGTGPAGNLYSSVLDLSKFLTCMFDEGATPAGPIVSPATFRTMTTPINDAQGNPQGFGIGFHIQDLDGNKKIGHGGAVYGFSTQLEAIPKRRIGVAAVAALDGSNGVVRRLADYALRLMIAQQDGKPLPVYRKTGPIPARRAAELKGSYREIDGKRLARITELNGATYLQRGSYRFHLRSAIDDGTILTDDVLGFGTEIHLRDAQSLSIGNVNYRRQAEQPPANVPDRWKGLIGEYGWDHNTLYILEDAGQLYALIEWFYYYPLTEVSENEFRFPDYGLYHGEGLKFSRNADGMGTRVIAAEVQFDRRDVGTRDGETFKITPVKPIDDLRDAALAASPPPEPGNYRQPDLVELTTLDPTIKLDIRYASTNNFTGAVFYKQSRAFMQRPAAQAVVRANERLKKRGLGLLVHDAYRPWHVTKMFWDATPTELKDFVANPANGSRHNRGCAVDITLYDLKTGEPIQMVAGYDEFSPRSFPMYPGGTARQRWYREFLRHTMEAEGFTVYEFEWWHFDYKDWKKYRIGNGTFEDLSEQTGEKK